VLGEDGNAIKLATNRPETTATMRTNRMRPIGRSADFTPRFSPTHRQQVAREQNETCACKFRRRFIFTGLCCARSHLREARERDARRLGVDCALTFCCSMRFLDRARRSRFRMRFRAEQSGGTNKSAAACPSDRPSFPPSPRAWPVTLGAADRPIGCALIISGRQQSLRRVILCENVVRNFAASVRSAGRATIRIHHHRSEDE